MNPTGEPTPAAVPATGPLPPPEPAVSQSRMGAETQPLPEPAVAAPGQVDQPLAKDPKASTTDESRFQPLSVGPDRPYTAEIYGMNKEERARYGKEMLRVIHQREEVYGLAVDSMRNPNMPVNLSSEQQRVVLEEILDDRLSGWLGSTILPRLPTEARSAVIEETIKQILTESSARADGDRGQLDWLLSGTRRGRALMDPQKPERVMQEWL